MDQHKITPLVPAQRADLLNIARIKEADCLEKEHDKLRGSSPKKSSNERASTQQPFAPYAQMNVAKHERSDR